MSILTLFLVCIPIPSALSADDLHPLSPEMLLLERDASSADYERILRDMIPTELAAEWQRAVNPDDAKSFAKKHGGEEKLKADPKLKAAYDRRSKIVEDYLELVRKEYKRRKLDAPFDKGAAAGKVPTATGKSESTNSITVVPGTPNAEDQWYRWRGPSAQGHVSDDDLPIKWSSTTNILWKTSIPGPGNSSPVIWSDRIFLTCSSPDGKVRSVLCFSRPTGEFLWKQDLKVEKMEPRVWPKNGFASATPTTDGERVIVFLGNIGMVCFDFEGKQLWRADLGPFNGSHGPGASPVLYGDLVLLNQDQAPGPSLSIALDKRTGEVVWRKKRPGGMGWCTPVIFRVGDRDEMIFSSNRHLYAMDPKTGEQLWSCDGPTEEPVPSVITGNGLIYCTTGRNGPTLAVVPGGSGNVTESSLVWTAVRGGPHVPSPILVDERIYFVNDRGILTCLSAADGSTVYQQRLTGKFTSSPIATKDLIYFTNEEGVTYIIRKGPKPNIVSTNDLQEPVLASFAVKDNRLYIRTPESLICIGEQNNIER